MIFNIELELKVGCKYIIMANIVITTHWTDGDVLPFIKSEVNLEKGDTG